MPGLSDYISTRLRGVLTTFQLFGQFQQSLTYGGLFKMAVNLTPLHDRVVVRRIEEKESIKGGIIIPDSAKEKQQEGEVIAVGSGKREKGEVIPLDVKPGDRVLFGKYSGTEIKIEDEELLILREEEILAKLSGAAKAAGGKK
jgi:chaperonin GroES